MPPASTSSTSSSSAPTAATAGAGAKAMSGPRRALASSFSLLTAAAVSSRPVNATSARSARSSARGGHRSRHRGPTGTATATAGRGWARSDSLQLMSAIGFVLIFALLGAWVGIFGRNDHPTSLAAVSAPAPTGLALPLGAAERERQRSRDHGPAIATDGGDQDPATDAADASMQYARLSPLTSGPNAGGRTDAPAARTSLAGAANATAATTATGADRAATSASGARTTSNNTPATTASVTSTPLNGPRTTLYFDGRPIRPVRTVTMLVTAYSPDARSCAPFDDGITASGKSVWTNGGRLIAADKKYKFGTLMSVPGYNGGRPTPVLDRGGAIKGNRLDVLYPTHNAARKWGVQRLRVTIWEYAD